MAQFQQGGAFGGTAHQQALEGSQRALGQELGDAATNVRAQQAEALRNEWTRAVGRQDELYNRQYDEFLRQQGWSQQQLTPLLQALSAIQGGTVATTGQNPNYRSAGQNAATYGALLASLYG